MNFKFFLVCFFVVFFALFNIGCKEAENPKSVDENSTVNISFTYGDQVITMSNVGDISAEVVVSTVSEDLDASSAELVSSAGVGGTLSEMTFSASPSTVRVTVQSYLDSEVFVVGSETPSLWGITSGDITADTPVPTSFFAQNSESVTLQTSLIGIFKFVFSNDVSSCTFQNADDSIDVELPYDTQCGKNMEIPRNFNTFTYQFTVNFVDGSKQVFLLPTVI